MTGVDSKTCAVTPATQVAGIGHNGGPASEPFGLRARWLRFANELELRRLAKLQVRIERRQRGLDDLRHEQGLIRNRCIRRMRRAAGKN
nr:hypothetical protein [Ruegeria pomeroyi]